MAVFETTTEQESLEPEQPPVEPAIEALKFINKLKPKSPEQIRGFFEEYQLYQVLTAVIETFNTSPGRPADIGFGSGGKNPDKLFHAGIVPKWTFQDGTSLPEHVHVWIDTYGQDKATGDPTTTIRALFINEDGTLQGRETLNGKYGRRIKQDDLDELGSFGILKHLCGAMIENLSIVKEEREKAEAEAREKAEQDALAA